MKSTFQITGIAVFLLTAGAAARAGELPAGRNDDDRPNILWIITDDQRADSLACYNRARYSMA